jgi:hypothetical protein
MKIPAINWGQSGSKADHLFLAGLAAALFISAAYILLDSGTPLPHPMDQAFITSADLRIRTENGYWIFRYPNLMFSGGISSSLIAGLYKLLVPTSLENLNWHIRIFSMVCYLSSSFLLIQQLIRTSALRLLALAILTTSGFQFIQPSSELLAGSFLTMFLVATINRWPLLLASFFLAMFGLAKVEMLAASIVMAGFWWLWERRRGNPQAVLTLLLTGAWLGLLLLPGFFIQGANINEMDRSMVAFIFTYAELFSPHQFSSSAQSIAEVVVQLQTGKFLGAHSVLQFVAQYPALYVDYLALSFFKGLGQLLHSLKFMILPMTLILGFRAKRFRPLMVLLLLASVLTLLPAWMFSYVRIRYLVKLFPAFIALTISGCEELEPSLPWIGKILWSSGIGTILWQLKYFNDMWMFSHWR